MRSRNGHTGSVYMEFSLRMPQSEIVYTPSLMQELKWAWLQFLSLYVVFYYMLNDIKIQTFEDRTFKTWKVVPWAYLKHQML